MSMKNSNDIIWIQTRGLLACSAVPQPSAPRRAPNSQPMRYQNEWDMYLDWPRTMGHKQLLNNFRWLWELVQGLWPGSDKVSDFTQHKNHIMPCLSCKYFLSHYNVRLNIRCNETIFLNTVRMSSYFHVLTSGKLYNCFLSPLRLKGMMFWHFKVVFKKGYIFK